jgi:hypothetical protein
MLKLTEKQIEDISETMKEELGDQYEDVRPILQRTFTVGKLRKALEGLDDSLPVELEIVLEVSDEGDCTAQPGFAIHSFQSEDRFTLVGALPGNSESYAEAFEIDKDRH